MEIADNKIREQELSCSKTPASPSLGRSAEILGVSSPDVNRLAAAQRIAGSGQPNPQKAKSMIYQRGKGDWGSVRKKKKQPSLIQTAQLRTVTTIEDTRYSSAVCLFSHRAFS